MRAAPVLFVAATAMALSSLVGATGHEFSRYDELEQELIWAETEVALIDAIRENQDPLRADLKKYRASNVALHRRVPEKPSPSSFTTRLEKIASWTGVECEVAGPFTTELEKHTETVVTVRLTGSQDEIAEFVSHAQNFSRVSEWSPPSHFDAGSEFRVTIFSVAAAEPVDLRVCKPLPLDSRIPSGASNEGIVRLNQLCENITADENLRVLFYSTIANRERIKEVVRLVKRTDAQPEQGDLRRGRPAEVESSDHSQVWPRGEASGIDLCDLLEHMGEAVSMSVTYDRETEWANASGELKPVARVSQFVDQSGCLDGVPIWVLFTPGSIVSSPDDETTERLHRLLLEAGKKRVEMMLQGSLQQPAAPDESLVFKVDIVDEIKVISPPA